MEPIVVNSYGSLYSKDFTVEKGIEVQTEQLAKWKKILNYHTYFQLDLECMKRNASPELETGYDVFRGSHIDNFVHNLYK